MRSIAFSNGVIQKQHTAAGKRLASDTIRGHRRLFRLAMIAITDMITPPIGTIEQSHASQASAWRMNESCSDNTVGMSVGWRCSSSSTRIDEIIFAEHAEQATKV